MPYDARREDDGFYSISGVPVFAEVPKGVKGAPFDIDKEWLQAALAKSKVREREGYLAPLHFEHHEGGERSFKAGHYRLTGVRQVSIAGQKKWALIAQLTKIPEHVFGAIMANEWPYRSVEIVSYKDREIESIALLDDDTPFHKFELLNADTIKVSEEEQRTDVPVLAGPVAFAKTERGYAGLFKFTEDRSVGMEFQLPASAREAFDQLDLDDAVMLVRQGEQVLLGGEPIVFAEDEKKGDGLPDDAKALKALMAKCKAKLSKLECDDDKKKMQEDDDQHKPGGDDDKDEKAKASNVEDAELLARFDSLEREVTTMKREKATRELVETTLIGLRDEGFHISKMTEAKFRSMADHGEQAFTDFVDHYRASVPKDGPEKFDGGRTDPEPEAVATFRTLGPEAHTKAQEANARFDELVAHNWRQDDPAERERFIRSELRRAGIKVAS